MDANKTHGGKAWRQLHKNAASKSWRQHPIKQQLYDHQPPITKTIQVRRTRHAGHCWRSKDELISDILLLTPSHRRAKAGRPARTYIQELCVDIGYSLEGMYLFTGTSIGFCFYELSRLECNSIYSLFVISHTQRERERLNDSRKIMK